MKKIFFIISLAIFLCNFVNAQTGSFYPVKNTNSGSISLFNSPGGTVKDNLPSGSALLQWGISNGYYRVDIPSSSGYEDAYGLIGTNKLEPVCNINYVDITASVSLNIRTCAGCTQNNQKVTKNGNAVYAWNTQSFVVLSTQYVSGTPWYQIYLTSGCSQSTGWISGGNNGQFSVLNNSNTIALTAPILNTATNITSTSLNLSWNAPQLSTKYDVYINSSLYAQNISTTSYPISGLNTNTMYSFYVVAKNNTGCISSNSNTISATTSGNILNAPINPFAQAVSSSQINLSWYDQSTNETGFEIWRSTSQNSGFTLIYTTPSNTSDYQDLNLQPNTTYYYQIRAVNNVSGTLYASSYITANATTFNCTSLPPPSSFYAYPTKIVAGNYTTLNALTTCTGCTYNWLLSYNGIYIPILTTNPNVSVSIPTPGTYMVQHWISNSCGSGSFSSAKAYINVDQSNTYNYSQAQTKTATIISPHIPKPVGSDPVNLITGQFEDSRSLLQMATVNGVIDFTVFYNGAITNYTDAGLGNGWSHSFDYRLYKEGDSIWKVHYPDLHETQFIAVYNDGNKRFNSFQLTKGGFDSLSLDTITGNSTLLLKNQIRILFDSTGLCIGIFDRNNNNTQTTHLTDGKIDKIIGVGGRTFSFSYNGNYISKVTATGGDFVGFTITNGDLVAITDAENNPYTFHYNNTHQIDSIRKPLGNYQVINEYTNGRITKQWDGTLIPNQFIYDSINKQSIIQYLDASSHSYQYDSVYAVRAETDEEGFSDSTVYDVNFIPTLHWDKNKILNKFTPDAAGNIVSIAAPYNTVTSRKFNAQRDLIVSINAANDSIKFDFQNGKLIKTTFEDGKANKANVNSIGQTTSTQDAKNNTLDSITYTPQGDIKTYTSPFGTTIIYYDSVGRPIVTIDPLGRIDSIFYDKLGRPIRHRNAAGFVEFWSYDVNGNLKSHTDFKNNTFSYVYDNNDQQTDEYGPLGFHNKTRYNFRGFKECVTNSNGDSLRYFLDKRGYLLGTQLNNYPRTVNTLDNEGHLLTTRDAEGKTVTKTLDSLYRNTKTDFNGVFNTKTTFDIKSNVTSTTDGSDNAKKYFINIRNNLDSIRDEADYTLKIVRDENQNPTNIIDGENYSNITNYDIGQRDTASTDGDNNTTKKIFNADGTTKLIVRPSGDSIGFTYTQLKQPKSVNYSSGNRQYNYTYDANGNNDTIIGSLGIDAFVYDSLNRPVAEKDVWNNTIQFVKNTLGLNIKIIYSGNKEVRIVYNAFNKPDTVFLWNGKFVTYKYDNVGQLKNYTTPDGITHYFGRDNAHRVIKKFDLKQTSANIDTVWNIDATRANTSDITNYSISGKQAFRPLIKTQHKQHTYKPNNAPTSTGQSYFLSNANGATTEQVGIDGKSIVRYAYVENDLLDSLHSDTTKQQFLWNGLEKLVSITTNGVQTKLIQNCTTSIAQLLMTQSANGTSNGYYIYGYAEPIAYVDSLGNFYYYHFDIFGNTEYLTNDTGAVTDRYAYDVFGTETRREGTSKQLLHAFGQHGALYINDSLVNIQSRFLQTNRGVFLTKDRASFDNKNPMTLHKYIYANNNPTGYYDMSGWCVVQSGEGQSIFEKMLANVESEPSLGTSLIPVYGSWRNAMYNANQGNYKTAAAYTGLALLDFIGVGEIIEGIKDGGQITAKIAIDESTHILNKNSNNAISNFGIYSIETDGELYKFGKADLERVTESSGQPTRLHQQLRKLQQLNPDKNVSGSIIEDLGRVTTKQAKIIENQYLQDFFKQTQKIPPGNINSFKPF